MPLSRRAAVTRGFLPPAPANAGNAILGERAGISAGVGEKFSAGIFTALEVWYKKGVTSLYLPRTPGGTCEPDPSHAGIHIIPQVENVASGFGKINGDWRRTPVLLPGFIRANATLTTMHGMECRMRLIP